jgi:hypothetical protein
MSEKVNPSVRETHGNPLSPLELLRDGASQELEGLIKLELAAEEMINEERALLGAYLAEDTSKVRGFWHELKGDMQTLELEVGQWLLSAADPTRVEWQLSHWWDGEDPGKLH